MEFVEAWIDTNVRQQSFVPVERSIEGVEGLVEIAERSAKQRYTPWRRIRYAIPKLQRRVHFSHSGKDDSFADVEGRSAAFVLTFLQFGESVVEDR